MLDSSLDSISLQELFNIIEVKQKQDNSKLFIISHRDAAEDEHYDNTIRVEKNNGITTIAEDTQGEMK